MLIRNVLALVLPILLVFTAPQAGVAEIMVDVELILAVDVSRSMDEDEQIVQRRGYVEAFQHPAVIDAIQAGRFGRIAVTYVEWAGANLQHIALPWLVVDGPASAKDFARQLAAIPLTQHRKTSISSALEFSVSLFAKNGFTSGKKVIDVSGDGPNNSGLPVAVVRDRTLAEGITINGLPIMLGEGRGGGFFDIELLDLYYEDCVIGGTGSFIVSVRHPDEFVPAIRRKLILEIAGQVPRLHYAQISRSLEPIDCMIGEKLWDAWINDQE
jgi:hypothetical protein